MHLRPRKLTMTGIKSYSETEWLMPLQVPIDINNAEQQYIFRATNLIFAAHSLEPQCTPIVLSFRDFTHKVISTMYDSQQDAAALLDRCSRLLDSSQDLDEEAHTQIRNITASFGAVRVAIKAGLDNLLSIEEPLISLLRNKYESKSILRYVPWFGKPSKGTVFLEALPTKLQDLTARLQELRDSVDTYEEQIHRICLQLAGGIYGSEAKVIAGRLQILADEMRTCTSDMPERLRYLQDEDYIIDQPPMWAWPITRRMEDNILKRDDRETDMHKHYFYYDWLHEWSVNLGNQPDTSDDDTISSSSSIIIE